MPSKDKVFVWAAGATVGAFIVLSTINLLYPYSRRKRLLVTRQMFRKDSVKVELPGDAISNDAACLLNLQRLIDVIERDIVPLTCISAYDGEGVNKVWMILGTQLS